jgi:hypothetical protein
MVLRRNTDATLPASHIIELTSMSARRFDSPIRKTLSRTGTGRPETGEPRLFSSSFRNTDATLPASHIIELTFTPTDPGRTVRDIGLVQWSLLRSMSARRFDSPIRKTLSRTGTGRPETGEPRPAGLAHHRADLHADRSGPHGARHRPRAVQGRREVHPGPVQQQVAVALDVGPQVRQPDQKDVVAHRDILTIEKGAAGERILREAFAQWP